MSFLFICCEIRSICRRITNEQEEFDGVLSIFVFVRTCILYSNVNYMCSRFREIDLFVVKTKHGIAAVQKLRLVHDHLRKEQCAGREFVSGNLNAE